MDRELRFNRSAAAFVSLTPNRGYRTVKIRYLAFWLGANNFLENLRFDGGRDRQNKLVKQYGDKRILEEADRAIRAIRKGDLDPVDSINRGIDHMLSAGLSNNTIRLFRYTICRFLLYSRLGLEPYDLSRAVKNVPRVWANLKRTPTREEVRSILLACDLRMKTLFSMLISTGARVGEILSIRKDQIDFSKTPVQVHLKATKFFRNRIGFLSSETVMLLKEYLNTRKDDYQYIFPGYIRGTSRPIDRPLARNSVWECFNRIRANLGLTQKYDKSHYYYRPGVFRVLNLDILKSAGYPPDWAEYLVGHNISFQASYIPPTTSLAKAWLRYDNQFCFLTTNTSETPTTEAVSPPTLEAKKDPQKSPDSAEPPSNSHRRETTRWRTKNFDYVKTDIESNAYDQAIADGFSIFDSSPNGIRVFRKRFRGGKQWLKSVNRTPAQKRTDFKDHGKMI